MEIAAYLNLISIIIYIIGMILSFKLINKIKPGVKKDFTYTKVTYGGLCFECKELISEMTDNKPNVKLCTKCNRNEKIKEINNEKVLFNKLKIANIIVSKNIFILTLLSSLFSILNIFISGIIIVGATIFLVISIAKYWYTCKATKIK